jgi:hypothetical protein
LRQFLFSFAADGCLTSWADEIATKAGGTTIKNNTEVRLKQMTKNSESDHEQADLQPTQVSLFSSHKNKLYSVLLYKKGTIE